MRNKDEGFPSGTSEATKAMLLKHKEEFTNFHVNLQCKLAVNNTALYVPVSQRLDIIL